MPRWFAAAGLFAAAVAVWLTVFFGGAYAVVWFIEIFEGDMSECWWAECGTFGEFLDNHDRLATLLLGFLAALPALAFLSPSRRPMRSRLAIASGVILATTGLVVLASLSLVVESVTFFALAAALALALALFAAAVARRSGLPPVATLTACLVFLSGYLAREWQRSDDAPGAGLGAAIAAALSLLVLAGGLLSVALDRSRARGRSAAHGDECLAR